MPSRRRLICLAIISLLFSVRSFSQSGYETEIKQPAIQLYNSFNKMQVHTGELQFGDTSRVMWNNLPVGLRARSGTSIGNMTVEQRKLVHRVLSAALSSQGYLKATSIMHLDDLLNKWMDTMLYNKTINQNLYARLMDLQWSHRNFYFAFYGKPTDDPWGFKLEGHHLSVNFTFSGGRIAVTPFFIGTDPAEYPETAYAGWRVLGQEEDLGLKLIQVLSADQKKKATQSTAVPGDIITAAESGKRLIDFWGIKASEFSAAQKELLLYIIREFVFNLEYDKAMIEYNKILKAGVDNIYFGWIGEYEEKKPHYYVINGPGFLIEFDNNGGPRNEANHVHAIWREKGNDFGEDVLKNHYQAVKHP